MPRGVVCCSWLGLGPPFGRAVVFVRWATRRSRARLRDGASRGPKLTRPRPGADRLNPQSSPADWRRRVGGSTNYEQLPTPRPRRRKSPGRFPVSNRAALNGIHVFKTGIRWCGGTCATGRRPACGSNCTSYCWPSYAKPASSIFHEQPSIHRRCEPLGRAPIAVATQLAT